MCVRISFDKHILHGSKYTANHGNISILPVADFEWYEYIDSIIQKFPNFFCLISILIGRNIVKYIPIDVSHCSKLRTARGCCKHFRGSPVINVKTPHRVFFSLHHLLARVTANNPARRYASDPADNTDDFTHAFIFLVVGSNRFETTGMTRRIPASTTRFDSIRNEGSGSQRRVDFLAVFQNQSNQSPRRGRTSRSLQGDPSPRSRQSRDDD